MIDDLGAADCLNYQSSIENHQSYPSFLGSDGTNRNLYWPRLWVSLDEKIREEIDNQQAIIDSGLYTSAAFIGTGFICLIYLFMEFLDLRYIKYLPKSDWLWFFTIGSFISSYLIYRFSLQAQIQFGEIYKSVFDLFRDNVDVEPIIKQISDETSDKNLLDLSQREKYHVAWRYLHYNRFKKGSIKFPTIIETKIQKK